MAESEKEVSKAKVTAGGFNGFSIVLTGIAVITVVIGASIGHKEVLLTGGFIALIAMIYLIAGTILLAVSDKKDQS